jgi:hypothetical protein
MGSSSHGIFEKPRAAQNGARDPIRMSETMPSTARLDGAQASFR